MRKERAVVNPEYEKSADRPPSEPVPSQLDVLVISIDPLMASVLGSAVEELGHRFELCAEPDRALGSAPWPIPHLVIVDWSIGQAAVTAVVNGVNGTMKGARSLVLVVAPTPHEEELRRLESRKPDDILVSSTDRSEIVHQLRVAESRIRHAPVHFGGWRPIENGDNETPASLEPLDGWWEWDVATDAVRYSARWRAMVGIDETAVEATPATWKRLVHPGDLAPLEEDLAAFLDGRIANLEHGHRMRLGDDTSRWVLTRCFAFRDPAGHAERVIGLHTDVTAQMQTEERLQFIALHDALTGLPNRTLFIDRLHQAFLRVQREPRMPFALFFLDVDRFKNVNDAFGHLTGDRLLGSIATRLEGALRPTDTVARFGGDEFVVLTEGIQDAHLATAIARRIQEAFQQPFELRGTEVFISLSMGIALWSERYTSSEELVRDADTAMYRAKAMGKNRFELFDEDMHREVVAALNLENDLRRAVDRQEFEVYYQPIVALLDGRISGFEALVRWRHPERGLLLPTEFIPLAEEIGLVVPIDRWVLEQACRQLRNWQVQFRQNPPLKINVNLSGIQFARPDLITQVDHIVRKSGLFGRSLNLEITESLIMEDASYAGAMLEQLKSLGIGICIDDFGTGYSSMSYLKKFDIDVLKIDQSFVSRMLEDHESLEIVRTITTLAHNLGKVTVVEGVETAAQLEVLRAMKPARIQGFYVSRPMPADKAQHMLELAFGSENHLNAMLAMQLETGRLEP